MNPHGCHSEVRITIKSIDNGFVVERLDFGASFCLVATSFEELANILAKKFGYTKIGEELIVFKRRD